MREQNKKWPAYPAIALSGLGLIVITTATPLFSYLAAAALIGLGLYLAFWKSRPANGEPQEAR